MSDQITFELHSPLSRSTKNSNSSGGDDWMADLPCDDESPRSDAILPFAAEGSRPNNIIWVGVDEETGVLCRVDEQQGAMAGFAVTKRRIGSALSMLAQHPGVLVNGIQALGLTVLLPRDSVVITPGIQSYVTERFRPYVGKPVGDLVGTKCPLCRLPITEETQVVTCMCGMSYHYETEESHGAIDEKDRLNCFSKVRVCLSCNRPVTLEEYLVWDPTTL